MPSLSKITNSGLKKPLSSLVPLADGDKVEYLLAFIRCRKASLLAEDAVTFLETCKKPKNGKEQN